MTRHDPISRGWRFLLGVLPLLFAVAGAALASPDSIDPSADPRAMLKQLRSSRLGPPLPIRGVRFETGFASLRLVEGLLFPARTSHEGAVELLFLGRGVVELEPPDVIEAGQLELFTGSDQLEESFAEAVFVVTRDEAVRLLLDRDPGDREPGGAKIRIDALTPRRAEELFATWKASPERRHLGVDAGLLGDALGDPLSEQYFAAWFRGDNLGEFLLLSDPAAEEQLSLGQFVPVDGSDRDKRRFSKILSREQRRGRLVGLEVEDLGNWDTWISTARRVEGQPHGGLPAFEPRHYKLDVTVLPRSGKLLGVAELTLVAVTGQRRMARLDLHRDLEVSRVTSEGRALVFLREGTEIHVVLERAPAEGEVVKVELTYAGQFLDRGRGRNWALRDALSWYPHAGLIDRATYEVTLSRPPKFDLLAGGRWVASGGDKKLRWDRHKLAIPTLGFSFEVGRFEIRRAHTDHVAVTVAFDPNLVAITGDTLSQLTTAITDSLAYYERLFGPYPLDELVVVTVPREYSQAMLGFVTLSNSMMVDWGTYGNLLGFTDRRAVIAHEIAHQWWGHLVGWRSYRDQWMSEAMANYSSQLWTRHRLGQLGPSGLTQGWQEELTATLADGRPLESIGPLVLGRRLDSSRSRDAYEAILYRKGALVLGMLANTFGEKQFVGMLRAVVDESRGRSLSTEDFLEMLEALSDTDLEAFARQFVYGTGLPEIFYDYDFEETDSGHWQVQIVARQETPSRYRYQLVERADGRLDVARQRLAPEHSLNSTLIVPFQVSFAGSAVGLQGHLEIVGEETEMAFELEKRPEDIWLDSRREVYGRFFNERRHPKRLLLYQGFELAAEGQSDEAEAFFFRALTTPTPHLPGGSILLRNLQAVADRLLNAQIHLEMARIRLASDRDEEARSSLTSATEALLDSERDWIEGDLSLLESRLDIRQGDYDRAFRRLRRGVLKRRLLSSVESYLLLAIAARETGHERELAEAVEAARKKGADVSPLVDPQ